MKKFLIIERATHRDDQDIQHIVESPDLAGAIQTLVERPVFSEYLADSLAMAYTEEAFPPTRNGKSILRYKDYLPEIVGVYEISGEVDFSNTLHTIVSNAFDKAVTLEGLRRSK